jgi:hypothetical protein
MSASRSRPRRHGERRCNRAKLQEHLGPPTRTGRLSLRPYHRTAARPGSPQALLRKRSSSYVHFSLLPRHGQRHRIRASRIAAERRNLNNRGVERSATPGPQAEANRSRVAAARCRPSYDGQAAARHAPGGLDSEGSAALHPRLFTFCRSAATCRFERAIGKWTPIARRQATASASVFPTRKRG